MTYRLSHNARSELEVTLEGLQAELAGLPDWRQQLAQVEDTRARAKNLTARIEAITAVLEKEVNQ